MIEPVLLPISFKHFLRESLNHALHELQGNVVLGVDFAIQVDNILTWASKVREQNFADLNGLVIDTLDALYTHLQNLGRWDTIIEYWDNVTIPAARESGNKLYEAKSELHIGTCLSNQGLLDLARQRYERANQLLQELNTEQALWELASTLFNLGTLSRRSGRLNDAHMALTKCVIVAQRSGNIPAWGYALGQLGNIACQRGDLQKAEQWYTESMKVWEKHDQLDGYAHTTLYQMSRLYREQGKPELALEVLQKSLIIKMRMGEIARGRAHCLAAIGQIELDLDRVDQAEEHFNEAYQISRNIADIQSKVDSLIGLALIDSLKNDKQAGRARLQAALEASKGKQLGMQEVRLYFYLAKLDYEAGHLPRTIFYGFWLLKAILSQQLDLRDYFRIGWRVLKAYPKKHF